MSKWSRIDRVSRFDPLEHLDCLAVPHCSMPSEWSEHVPLAMLLIEILRPELFVELRTYHGVSYFAFCQAVSSLGLRTRCIAIDTWQGDQCGGACGEEVFLRFREHHDAHYATFSRYIRADFAAPDIAGQFADGSIDLLHLDGDHGEDVVRRDLVLWLPKLSKRGVLLMHDVASHLPGFGVWKVWEELQSRHPSFQLDHQHGLGMVALGSEVPDGLRELIEAGPDDSAKIREYFRLVGKLAGDLSRRGWLIHEHESQLAAYERKRQWLEDRLTALERQLKTMRHEMDEIATDPYWRLTRKLKRLRMLALPDGSLGDRAMKLDTAGSPTLATLRYAGIHGICRPPLANLSQKHHRGRF